MLKASEWMAGGVDEPTFISNAVPLFRDMQSETIDMEKIEANLKKLDAGEKIMEQLTCNPEALEVLEKIVKALKEKAEELTPEFCRQLFKLMDLDNSGKITSRELHILKATMDGFLRLGAVEVMSVSSLDACLPPEDAAKVKEM